MNKFTCLLIVVGVCTALTPPHYGIRHGDTFHFNNIEDTFLTSFPDSQTCNRCKDGGLPAMHKILKLDNILTLGGNSANKQQWTLNRHKDGFFHKKKFVEG